LPAGDAVGHRQDHHHPVADRRLHGQVSGETRQAVVQHPDAVGDRKGRGRVARALRLLQVGEV